MQSRKAPLLHAILDDDGAASLQHDHVVLYVALSPACFETWTALLPSISLVHRPNIFGDSHFAGPTPHATPTAPSPIEIVAFLLAR